MIRIVLIQIILNPIMETSDILEVIGPNCWLIISDSDVFVRNAL